MADTAIKIGILFETTRLAGERRELLQKKGTTEEERERGKNEKKEPKNKKIFMYVR